MNYLDIEKIINNTDIKVHVVEEKIDLYNDIARAMVNKLIENNHKNNMTSFILPVGPRGQYKRFARICNLEKISCKNLITINMDEYLDNSDNLISEDSPLSFRSFMDKNLFDLLDEDLIVKKENIYFPDPNNIDLISKIIDKLDGVDICFGGIGINGHIAFNEALSEEEILKTDLFESRTRIVDIAKETKIINSLNYGGFTEIIPNRCITIGLKEIFSSKELRFYLEHNWQSSVLKRVVCNSPTPSFPATYLKKHKKSSLTITRDVLSGYSWSNIK